MVKLERLDGSLMNTLNLSKMFGKREGGRGKTEPLIYLGDFSGS